MTEAYRIIAIDFDRVIHDIDHPIEGRRMGRPLPGALESINKLFSDGHQIIVHTLWATTPAGKIAVEKWLEYWNFPPFIVTNIKPKADYYVDDKAIRHIDWPTTMEAIHADPSAQ